MHVTKMHAAFANATIARTARPLAKRVVAMLETHQQVMVTQAKGAAVKAAEARIAREKKLARLATSLDPE